MADIAQSRMSADDATAALHEVERQLQRHCDGCAQCRAARYGQVSRIWKSCQVGLELFRSEMALTHRINYLSLKARRSAAAGAANAYLVAVKAKAS